MLKRLTILLIEFAAGLVGNLVAGWIQQDVWSNLFTKNRILGALAGAVLMLIVLTWLESERLLAWNWPWHRFWYLRELLNTLQGRVTNYISLELSRVTKPDSTPDVESSSGRDFINTLTSLINSQGRKILVLGEPGSGKTTGLEKITLDLALKSKRRLSMGERIPVLVRLGNYRVGELLNHVTDVMRYGSKSGSGKVLARGVEELFKRGKVVLLFDALDEVPSEQSDALLAQLDILLNSAAFQQVPVIITSRTQENPGNRLPNLDIFSIQPLSDESIETFIQTYKRPQDSESEILVRLKKHGLLQINGLARNPFWLGLILASGVFEGNKSEILNNAVDILLIREWEKPIANRSKWRRILPEAQQLEITKQGLARLSYFMSLNNSVELNKNQAANELNQWMTSHPGANELIPQDILGLSQDAQILSYEPPSLAQVPLSIRFRHRLLQEFLTAWAFYTNEKLLTASLLNQCIGDSRWWETILLLGELLDKDTTLESRQGKADCRYHKLIRAVLDSGAEDDRLFLAVGLLRSATELDRELEQGIISALTEMFRRGITDRQKQAALELVKIADDKAIQVLGSLLKHENTGIRNAGIELLGEIGTDKAVNMLIRYLNDKVISGNIVSALVISGKPAVIALMNAIKDTSPHVRVKAVEALGRIGDIQALELLFSALRDSDSTMSQAAAIALVRMGRVSVTFLIEALQDEEMTVRKHAAWALGEIGDVRAVEPLIALIRIEEDQKVQEILAASLVTIGNPAIEPLIESIKEFFLKNPRHDRQRELEDVLVKIGNPVLQPVAKLLSADDWRLRMQAMHILEQCADESIIEQLIGILHDSAWVVTQSVMRTLAKIGGPAVESLIAQLENKDYFVRKYASEALGLIGDVRAVEPLISLLMRENHNSYGCGEIAMALGRIGDARAVKPLILKLRTAVSESSWSLSDIEKTLEEIGAPAVDTLISFVNDEKPRMRSKVISILGKIGDARAIGPLITKLTDSDGFVSQSAAYALSKIGNSAVIPLTELLQEKAQDIKLKSLIAEALGAIGDPQSILYLMKAAEELKDDASTDMFWKAIEKIAKFQQKQKER